ncbi:MAG: SDR family oxidoreductase [Candidatus Lokiarchaeota archaeon]|nr:SDR family oxidoreductase [Candidatus Lokiarchaeota archaeon]
MKDLKGKNCFITGAASGIGRSVALELAREGMNLYITDINEEGLANVKKEIEEIGVKVISSKCDVSKFEDWEKCEGVFRENLGDIDLLVNNAGIAIGGSILQLELEDWEKVLGVNLWSIIYSLKTFVPRMLAKGSGHIVNVSSGAGIFGSPEPLPYVTTKFAVVGLSEALFGSLNGMGINVSVICPWVIATNIWNISELKVPQKLIEDVGEEKIEEMMNEVRQGFLDIAISPDEVAKIYVKEIKENKLYICDNKDYFNILALKGKPQEFENALKMIHAERTKNMRDRYSKMGINIDDYR